ncbi:MAG: superoxide dismutase family protein [Thermomicrobiales bacterium]
MNWLKRRALALASLSLMAGLLVGSAGVTAQATPEAVSIESPVVDAAGAEVGTLYVYESDFGVTLTVLLEAGTLEPGAHGVHLHEIGSCDPSGDSTFALAGAHFNPTNQLHGAPNLATSHAGDLGNLTVTEDGSAMFSITLSDITLASGVEGSLMDADGAVLLIHAGEDDLTTDPSGESGERLLCSMISASTVGTTVATPAA